MSTRLLRDIPTPSESSPSLTRRSFGYVVDGKLTIADLSFVT